MKKITLFTFAIAALSLASCKKDYVCECTSTTTSGNVTYVDVTTISAKSKKKSAEEWCKSNQTTTYSYNGISLQGDPTSCKLK